ncbi:TetR/AcrR family transcriptional regulator [Paenalcaligenes niemegkensis]|uniref:TetR/AcrR family transcriptional regulator n=1 Tax=Paenalcaligenes niemegkensis TaxID=2895469 RepID=UPI001EE89A13|nr:TetR/AcrR family transcriptional regulator [Paenalcaligenes niemegkensis]MCQ9616137.1 TetR/AcrR family transcriptional regulator [Paenalcaligenes niemegkensis]
MTKRTQILETALRLFSRESFHRVGVDRVKKEAGVSKMTLYKHFPTKEALIEAVLLLRDQHFHEGLEAAVASAHTPHAQIKAIFDWHREWFAQEGFYGCMFIKASEEFEVTAGQIHPISRDHKLYIERLLTQRLTQLDPQLAQNLATHLLVVLEGLIIHAHMFPERDPTPGSWALCSQLFKAHGIS